MSAYQAAPEIVQRTQLYFEPNSIQPANKRRKSSLNLPSSLPLRRATFVLRITQVTNVKQTTATQFKTSKLGMTTHHKQQSDKQNTHEHSISRSKSRSLSRSQSRTRRDSQTAIDSPRSELHLIRTASQTLSPQHSVMLESTRFPTPNNTNSHSKPHIPTAQSSPLDNGFSFNAAVNLSPALDPIDSRADEFNENRHSQGDYSTDATQTDSEPCSQKQQTSANSNNRSLHIDNTSHLNRMQVHSTSMIASKSVSAPCASGGPILASEASRKLFQPHLRTPPLAVTRPDYNSATMQSSSDPFAPLRNAACNANMVSTPTHSGGVASSANGRVATQHSANSPTSPIDLLLSAEAMRRRQSEEAKEGTALAAAAAAANSHHAASTASKSKSAPHSAAQFMRDESDFNSATDSDSDSSSDTRSKTQSNAQSRSNMRGNVKAFPLHSASRPAPLSFGAPGTNPYAASNNASFNASSASSAFGSSSGAAAAPTIVKPLVLPKNVKPEPAVTYGKPLRVGKLFAVPVFHPTVSEWSDPLAYIASIESECVECGLARIIPPRAHWSPHFALPEQKNFRFRTRIQNLATISQGRGFDKSSDKYELRQFEKEANEWKRKFCKLKGLNPNTVTPAQLEQIYWAIVDQHQQPIEGMTSQDAASSQQTAATGQSSSASNGNNNSSSNSSSKALKNQMLTAPIVEYGNDLDTSVYGSGFEVLSIDAETQQVTTDASPYAGSIGWNLRLLPLLPSSLLSRLDEHILGVTTPWLYIGMMFASFCLHCEDDYLYSINYLHAGESKSWYGVRAADAEKVESCMRAERRLQYKTEPDLHHKLITQISPQTLMQRAGLKVFHTVQRAGDFVVTFPRAYHCGFSHGFNVGEAVNFALTDRWWPFGQAARRVYKRFKRSCVFSHIALLLKCCMLEPHKHTASVLAANLTQVISEESKLLEKIEQRSIFRRQATPLDAPVGQCCVCRDFCYISHIECSNPRCRRRRKLAQECDDEHSAHQQQHQDAHQMSDDEDDNPQSTLSDLDASAPLRRRRPAAESDSSGETRNRIVCLQHWRRVCWCERRVHLVLHQRFELTKLKQILQAVNAVAKKQQSEPNSKQKSGPAPDYSFLNSKLKVKKETAPKKAKAAKVSASAPFVPSSMPSGAFGLPSHQSVATSSSALANQSSYLPAQDTPPKLHQESCLPPILHRNNPRDSNPPQHNPSVPMRSDSMTSQPQIANIQHQVSIQAPLVSRSVAAPSLAPVCESPPQLPPPSLNAINAPLLHRPEVKQKRKRKQSNSTQSKTKKFKSTLDSSESGEDWTSSSGTSDSEYEAPPQVKRLLNASQQSAKDTRANASQPPRESSDSTIDSKHQTPNQVRSLNPNPILHLQPHQRQSFIHPPFISACAVQLPTHPVQPLVIASSTEVSRSTSPRPAAPAHQFNASHNQMSQYSRHPEPESNSSTPRSSLAHALCTTTRDADGLAAADAASVPSPLCALPSAAPTGHKDVALLCSTVQHSVRSQRDAHASQTAQQSHQQPHEAESRFVQSAENPTSHESAHHPMDDSSSSDSSDDDGRSLEEMQEEIERMKALFKTQQQQQQQATTNNT